MVVLDSLEHLNGLDLANGAHRNKKLIFYNVDLFTNISLSMMDQCLKFDLITSLDTLIMINDADLIMGRTQLGSKGKKKKVTCVFPVSSLQQCLYAFAHLGVVWHLSKKVSSMTSAFLSFFSWSMMNNASKFKLIAVLGILKRPNGLNFVKEVRKSPNNVIERSLFFFL